LRSTVNALLFMTDTQIPRNEHDVIIVGAGVAGAALATVLARARGIA